MDASSQAILQRLLQQQPIGALGTLRQGHGGAEPFVSMVPVAWVQGRVPVLHVSLLAAHTRDLQAHAGVSLMLTAPLGADDDPQALPRLTLQADAQFLAAGSADADAARTAYLQRFPRAGQTFALADFRLVKLQPGRARFIAGFGRAFALSPADLAAF